uniref:Sushi domain-containing protein n=1 Tax=Anopheles atroparvus TaxID=41427 RepID=A0AAG5DP88_ANOAO
MSSQNAARGWVAGRNNGNTGTRVCCRRRHLSNKPPAIMAGRVLLLLALSMLTVVPLAGGHPRNSGRVPANEDPTSSEADGTANRGPPGNPQQRVYENVQRGSITLPLGSEAFLAPDDNRTLAFSSQSDPTIYRPRAQPQARRRNGRPQQQGHGHRMKGAMASGARRHGLPTQQKFSVIDGLCISCPPEKTAVAREGLDGVLIEPPVLATCTGRPISKDLYELETLFGPKFNFVLPHSNGAPYSFLAKVVSKLTGNTVLTCDLRYRVVVKQCRRYKPKNRDLKVSCSLNSIWGSRCTFHCRSGGYLSRPNSYVKCGANEIWEGEEPYCTFNDVSDDYAADSDPNNTATTDCQLDIPPAHGRFACDLKDTESASNELAIPNGTACQVKCNEGHYIPTHLQPAAYFGCVDGRWNNTMRHFCYKTTQIAIGNSQRHRGYG